MRPTFESGVERGKVILLTRVANWISFGLETHPKATNLFLPLTANYHHCSSTPERIWNLNFQETPRIQSSFNLIWQAIYVMRQGSCWRCIWQFCLCKLEVERAGKGGLGVGLYCCIGSPAPMEYNVCFSCLVNYPHPLLCNSSLS